MHKGKSLSLFILVKIPAVVFELSRVDDHLFGTQLHQIGEAL